MILEWSNPRPYVGTRVCRLEPRMSIIPSVSFLVLPFVGFTTSLCIWFSDPSAV